MRFSTSTIALVAALLASAYASPVGVAQSTCAAQASACDSRCAADNTGDEAIADCQYGCLGQHEKCLDGNSSVDAAKRAPESVSQCQSTWATCRDSCPEDGTVCAYKCFGDYERCVGVKKREPAVELDARVPETTAQCLATDTKCREACPEGDSVCGAKCLGNLERCEGEKKREASTTLDARAPETTAQCLAADEKCRNACPEGDSVCGAKCLGNLERCEGEKKREASATLAARAPESSAQCAAQASACDSKCAKEYSGDEAIADCQYGCLGKHEKCLEGDE